MPGKLGVTNHDNFSPLPPGACVPATVVVWGPSSTANSRALAAVTNTRRVSPILGSGGTKEMRSSPSQPHRGLAAGAGATGPVGTLWLGRLPIEGVNWPVGGPKGGTVTCPVIGLTTKEGVVAVAKGVSVAVAVNVAVAVEVAVTVGSTGVGVAARVSVGTGVSTPMPAGSGGGASSRHALPATMRTVLARASRSAKDKSNFGVFTGRNYLTRVKQTYAPC